MNRKELELILQEGEGYKIEFKESLNNIDRELVAFANSSGGRIFLGITDAKEIKGMEITNKLKSQIQDTSNNCQPPVKVLFEEFENILIINVREGDDKPYKCSSGFYTRVGPNAQKLDRDDIIEFFKSEGKIRFDELINLKFDYDTHFDPKKLDKFLILAGISRVMDVPSILVNLGVAERQEGKVIFNNTGILLFSKNLQNIYYHTAVTCALYKGTEKVDVLDRRDFNEDIISNIDGAMNFLKRYIAVKYEMTGTPRRREIPEIPYDALREAIVNAVAHRDYFEKGSNVMVEMFDDRIEITNFGGLPKGLKPQDFGKKSVLRNPNIADLLHRVEYIEKMGTGINKIRKLVSEAGLPPVEFEFGNFFTVIFKKQKIDRPSAITEVNTEILTEVLSREAVIRDLGERVKIRLMKELLHLIQNGFITIKIVEKIGKISNASAKRDLSLLKKIGIINFEGSRKIGRYVLKEKGKAIIEELRK
ncbi:MAG: ATP-binding protein [Candidatus Methanoperedens sp.]|nr:ATP-binding protein [Candidatus Methanoperedens sp.]